jgi:hypothetical protein
MEVRDAYKYQLQLRDRDPAGVSSAGLASTSYTINTV